MVQFVQVREAIERVELVPGWSNRLVWCWNVSDVYSTSSTYNMMFIGQSQLLDTKELWKTKAPGKCCFFDWLVLHDRTWTSDRLW
jgi:hypothetical protein